MKQKMSRESGAGCVADAFANGPGAELCSDEPRKRHWLRSSRFCEWSRG